MILSRETLQNVPFASAKGGLLVDISDEIFDNPGMVAEVKLDGSRYRLALLKSGNILQSRRVSVVTKQFVEKTDNVPHISNIVLPGFEDTVVEGEMIVRGRSSSSEVTKIMGSGPEKAAARQKESGKLEWRMYDILFYKGNDLRSDTFRNRRRYLEKFYKHLVRNLSKKVSKYFSLTEIFYPQAVAKHHRLDRPLYDYCCRCIDSGLEGAMIKNLYASYGSGMYKAKRYCDCDVFAVSFTAGKGKYKGMIGAIEFAVLDGKKSVKVGQCSGMDDEMRKRITKNPKKYLNHPMEVRGQEISRTKDGGVSIRHPRFLQWRTDINKKHCTLKKLLDYVVDEELEKS